MSKISTSTKVDQKKLIFITAEDWAFVTHRLPMARAALRQGFRVLVATRVRDHDDAIRAEGIEVVDIPMDRGSVSPLTEMRTVLELLRLIWREQPAIVHNVAVKPIVHGTLAALLASRCQIANSFTGMGSVLDEAAAPTRLSKLIYRICRLYASSRRVTAIVQNEDDRALLLDRKLAHPDRLELICGSGVSMTDYARTPEPSGTPVALMVARLLRDKGVMELVEAAHLLKARGIALTIRIAGRIDAANPTSLTDKEFADLEREGLVEFLGHRTDIAQLFQEAHIAVLPSYREGLPKSLLEAAAVGRPLVTTDVPGCRQLVPENSTGRLVKVRDAISLANALEELAGSQELRERLGAAAHELVQSEYADTIVSKRISALYACLVAKNE